MRNQNRAALPGEEQRLETCSLERIRTPGTVQRHGALVAVDGETFEITHASDNCAQLLDTEATELLGRPVTFLTGVDSDAELRDVLDPTTATANPREMTVLGQPFSVVLHQAGPSVIIEFERSIPTTDALSAPAMYAALHRLAEAQDKHELWDATAREIAGLTLFDRVMIYHFHPDGHGEVVAEAVADDLEPFLGLHYPASDIPAQARELYLVKRSRLIVNSGTEPSDILSVPNAPELDLSLAELRSVSPHHLQFMKNMGQTATLSLSLIHNGELVGMITCAHRMPRRISYALRQGLEVLAHQVALQLASMEEIVRLRRQVQVRRIRSQLVAQLAGGVDPADALLDGEVTALDLIPASGVTLRLRGRMSSRGETPPPEVMKKLADSIFSQRGKFALMTDALSVEHPNLAGIVPGVAGLLMLPLGGNGGFIAWLRPEKIRDVQWLGDQSPANRLTPLSPRMSFSAWRQSVSGTADPWDGLELEGEELCRDLDSALLRRAESELAAVALHDSLTGLPNRRMLLIRLEHALTKYARGEELSLLFIDIDGVKNVNDVHGHDQGDAVIIHVARQLLATTRAQDTVARLGGDEFVVVCEATTVEEADIVATRIGRAIRQPVVLNGKPMDLSASIGVVGANLQRSAAEFLRQADSAMYRAKSGGRDRASR